MPAESVSPTSPRVTPLPISRAAIGCDGRVVVAPIAAYGWSGNRLSRNCYVVSIAVEEGRRERAALDWSSPPIRICGPSSLFGAGDDLGRSVLKWQMRDDHIAATALRSSAKTEMAAG